MNWWAITMFFIGAFVGRYFEEILEVIQKVRKDVSKLPIAQNAKVYK